MCAENMTMCSPNLLLMIEKNMIMLRKKQYVSCKKTIILPKHGGYSGKIAPVRASVGAQLRAQAHPDWCDMVNPGCQKPIIWGSFSIV